MQNTGNKEQLNDMIIDSGENPQSGVKEELVYQRGDNENLIETIEETDSPVDRVLQ
jgi:hypothetical protein